MCLYKLSYLNWTKLQQAIAHLIYVLGLLPTPHTLTPTPYLIPSKGPRKVGLGRVM